MNILYSSGAFSAIKDAYDESTDAAKKVDASGNTVKESADNREETRDLQGNVQPDNTRDLNKLNQNMAAQPDLTPVAKQVTASPDFLDSRDDVFWLFCYMGLELFRISSPYLPFILSM